MIDLTNYRDETVLLCEDYKTHITLRTHLKIDSLGGLTITQETVIDGMVIAEDNIYLEGIDARGLQSCLNDTFGLAPTAEITVTA